MVAPTAAEIRSWSKLGFGELGYADDVSLGRLVARATAAFVRITGQTLETVQPADVPLVEQAIQGLTEQLAFQTQQDNLETLSDFDLIQSFSAGPYSETRRSPEAAMKARMLNAWPWLNELLWGLLTPDRYDYWVGHFGGGNAPAFGVTEVAWNDYAPDAPMWGGDA